MRYGLGGSLLLSALLLLAGNAYVKIYQVEAPVRVLAYQFLIVFAIISPIKVQNMILGGGILRSGGKTKYVMVVDGEHWSSGRRENIKNTYNKYKKY